MRDLLEKFHGEELTRKAYQDDFSEHFWAIRENAFLKLERRQVFQEPEDESWTAYSAGEWKRSLRLLDERRDAIRDYYRRIDKAGFRTRRVRVVEEPVTPYLRWELHLLRIRHQYGGSVRVVGAADVRPLETTNLLPELVVLGDDVMYEVLYNEHGILSGGVRYADHSLIARCKTLIERLYRAGEDVTDYFARNGATLELSCSGA
ncbi:DUF6879 family protein [Microbispora amethystogenes]|uniref:DUF6879 domain-containing protein n=1 Tax=Microbispora amethystogenes TaxID=1427754 RepID=A0ABQ4FF01_9ACTN|nr:DUF6879 family protein [Microbispora amethystogenes]GIH33375.1 hypothetical protein Mam01_35390 [Microbispora amethystogenes]